MTEFEYDSYIKKNIAHSAMRRKGGSKSRKCPLSTDHMTQKQWKERCGEVMSYRLGKPMKWVEFNKLPSDLKEKYMNDLITRFSMNARNFAEMFDVSVATVFRAVKNDDLNVVFAKGRKPTGDQKIAYEKFLSGSTTDEVCEHDFTGEGAGSIAIAEESVVVNVPEQNLPETRLDSFTMNFSGKINVDMVANSLKYILGANSTATIQIVCHLE